MLNSKARKPKLNIPIAKMLTPKIHDCNNRPMPMQAIENHGITIVSKQPKPGLLPKLSGIVFVTNIRHW